MARCSEGCYDFSKAFGVPFISGKDSLNNTWRDKNGKVSSIPGTLLISAIAVVDDVRQCVTMDFKRPGNAILLAGETRNELGGSHLNEVLGISGGRVPKVDAQVSLKLMRAIREAVSRGLVRSCHDLSEGGLAVALAEMCIAGGLGAKADLSAFIGSGTVPSLDEAILLFSESAGRWILEVEPGNLARVKKIFSGLPLASVGKVEKDPVLKIKSKKELVRLKTADMKKAWRSFSERQ